MSSITNLDTSGFYRLNTSNLLYAPNFVLSKAYSLYKDTHDEHVYPVDGWYWFNTEEEARAFFGLGPLQLPILNAVDPTIIPLKAYDRVWIEQIIITAPDPNGDAYGEVKLRKYGVFDGIAELEPGNGEWIRVEDMLAKSSEDNDLSIAMSALLAYIGKIGVENNVIAPPA